MYMKWFVCPSPLIFHLPRSSKPSCFQLPKWGSQAGEPCFLPQNLKWGSQAEQPCFLLQNLRSGQNFRSWRGGRKKPVCHRNSVPLHGFHGFHGFHSLWSLHLLLCLQPLAFCLGLFLWNCFLGCRWPFQTLFWRSVLSVCFGSSHAFLKLFAHLQSILSLQWCWFEIFLSSQSRSNHVEHGVSHSNDEGHWVCIPRCLHPQGCTCIFQDRSRETLQDHPLLSACFPPCILPLNKCQCPNFFCSYKKFLCFWGVVFVQKLRMGYWKH